MMRMLWVLTMAIRDYLLVVSIISIITILPVTLAASHESPIIKPGYVDFTWYRSRVARTDTSC